MKHPLVYHLQVYINIFNHTQHLLCNPSLWYVQFSVYFRFFV